MSPTDRLDRLERDLDEIASLVREIGGTVIEHTARLQNGIEVMKEMKEDIVSLRPKVPNWFKVMGAVLGFLVTYTGAYYWFIQRLNDRPTADQIDKIIHEHVESGHPSVTKDINAIRDAVIIQGTTLKGVADNVSRQDAKLDMLLERVRR